MFTRSATLLIALIVALIPAQSATAQQPDARAAKVAALLEPWNSPDRPGAAVAVMLDDRIVADVAVGSADIENRVPITPHSVFHAASLSKQFTAFAILLLEQDGRLSIDDPLSKYLPETASLGPITLLQLLHHTSGLREHLTLLAAAGWRPEDLVTDDQVMTMLLAQRGGNAVPGTAYQYINSDYYLLGQVVRRVSGKTLAEFCRERIFGPLGMVDSRFQDDLTALIPDRVQSYRPTANGYGRAILNSAATGSTGLATTTADLSRWALNLRTGKVGGPRLLRRMEEQGVLADGTVNDYAMGQDHHRYRGFDAWMHGGRDAGFRSFLLRVPGERLSVAVLANVSDFDGAAIASAIADIYLADRPGYRMDRPGGPTAPTKRQLAAYAGTYKLFPGLIFTLDTDGQRLFMTPLGQAKASELPTLSATQFRLAPKSTVTIEFPRIVDGKVAGFTWRVGLDGIIAARRIALAPFDADGVPLRDYVGRYRSDELDTDYTLLMVDGKLVARHRKRPDILLSPYQDDMFASREWSFQQLAFERDVQGRVTGFHLSAVNADGMRFDRLETP